MAELEDRFVERVLKLMYIFGIYQKYVSKYGNTITVPLSFALKFASQGIKTFKRIKEAWRLSL
jgi:hypothetical protein